MTNPPTDFDILARNAAAMNAEECLIEPHWTDDPAFESDDQWRAVMAGEIPHPDRNEVEWVYLGKFDGVSEWRDRSKMTGGDHADRRNHLRRVYNERACKVIYEYGKGEPK